MRRAAWATRWTPPIKSNLAEARQLVNLILSTNPEAYLSKAVRDKNYYCLTPEKVLIVCDKYRVRTVLYCTVLYCALLYSSVLCCTVLYCTVLYCTVLYVLYCTTTVQYSSNHFSTVLYCTVLYCCYRNTAVR